MSTAIIIYYLAPSGPLASWRVETDVCLLTVAGGTAIAGMASGMTGLPKSVAEQIDRQRAGILATLQNSAAAHFDQTALQDFAGALAGAHPAEPGEQRTVAESDPEGSDESADMYDVSQALVRPAESERNDRFTRVLIEYYAYGLVQARWSASISLALSAFGAMVLMSGVVLAFVRSFAGTTVTSTVVVSTAGVVTTGLGTLMHQQANRALKHMQDQTAGLRIDMQAAEDRQTALRLLADMPPGDDLQARLQAALVLKLTGAVLPEAGLLPTMVPVGEANGTPRSRAAMD